MIRFHQRPVAWAVLLAAGVLTACSDPSPPDSVQAPAPTEVRTPASPPVAPSASAEPSAPPETPTSGGDGSEIQLSALSEADLKAEPLQGELGCNFSAEPGSTLLVAQGDVAAKTAAQGLVKVGDYVERVVAPGGFNGMLKGAVFTGAGKTIRIAVTGPATGGGESPPRPATLTYERADGASRTFAGRWTCGP
ncbi:hypothetical protein BH10PSE3_BH10PSE3_17550 [soil metagenome]